MEKFVLVIAQGTLSVFRLLIMAGRMLMVVRSVRAFVVGFGKKFLRRRMQGLLVKVLPKLKIRMVKVQAQLKIRVVKVERMALQLENVYNCSLSGL